MESRVVSLNGREGRVSGETGELGCGRKRIFLGISMISVIKSTAPQVTLPLKNDLQGSTFKQCVTLSTQDAGKALFIRGRKGIHRECDFNPLSCRKSFVSET